MSPHRTDFSRHSPCSRVINGINPDAPTSATAVGEIPFLPHLIYKSKTILAQNALYVPTCPVRLFSVTSATNNGASVWIQKADTSGFCGYLFIHNLAVPLYRNSGLIIFHAKFTANPPVQAYHGQPSKSGPVQPPPTFAPSTPPRTERPRQAAKIAPRPSPKACAPIIKQYSQPSLSKQRVLWHARFMHSGDEIESNTTKVVLGGPSFTKHDKRDPYCHCRTCNNAKMHHKPVPHSRVHTRRANTSRRLVYTDWWGPYAHAGINGEQYIQAFLDDASGAVVCFASRSKDCGAANLAKYCSMLEEQTDGRASVKIIQGDFEKLFTHGAFAAECSKRGIIQRFSAPYSHQQNGRIERFWRTMENRITAMLDYSSAPRFLWPFALQTFVSQYNRMSNSDGELTPFEQLTGNRPDVSSFRVWGCPSQAFLQKSAHEKFTSKCLDCINIGPNLSTKDGYYIYIPSRRAILTTRHITFDELWRARAEHTQQMQAAFPHSAEAFDRPSAPPDPNESDSPASPTIDDDDDDGTDPVVLPPVAAAPPPDHSAARRRPEAADAASVRRAAAPRVQPPRAGNHVARPLLFGAALPPPDPAPALRPRRAPPGRSTAANILAPPRLGPNTNLINKRNIPITPRSASTTAPGTDVLEVSHIVRTGVDTRTGQKLYTGFYPNSYNMTPSAIHERTHEVQGGRNFEIAQQTPSIYDPTGQNSDIVWKQFGEPPANFPQRLIDNFNATADPRAARLAARQETAAAPLGPSPDTTAAGDPAAFACTCTRSKSCVIPERCQSTVPFTVIGTDAAPVSAYHASPISIVEPESSPKNHLPFVVPRHPFRHFHSILSNGKSDEAYAYLDILPTGDTPKNITQALASVDRKHWKFALDSEYDQLVDANTWKLVPRNQARNVISGKWIFKIKKNQDGTIDRYKARWVARGFSQKRDIDYTEIFAPVVRYSSVRLLLSLANALDLNLYGLDVSNAFARSVVDEELYVSMPTGYQQTDSSGTPLVCKLCKGLYGTKQAARLWQQTLRKHLLDDGWCQFESDSCIYLRETAKFGTEYVGIYVDDIIHIARSDTAHSALHKYCNQFFPTTTQGELTWILGMEVKRDRSTRTLSLNQKQGIVTFLESCGMRNSKALSTPMDSQWKYGDDHTLLNKEEHSDFRSKVGSLSYFAQCTRPDIAFAVNILCRNLHIPNRQCVRALNHLIQYLAGTTELGLQFHFGESSSLKLEAYADSSYGGDDSDQAKSHHGYLIYFAGGLIDWNSTLQNTIALSSAEAEHIAAFHASRTVFYYRQLLEEFGHAQGEPTIVWEDNQACIAQSKNPVNHKRCKHILIKYHYLRHLTASNIVRLEYVVTKSQIADLLTKPVTPAIFQHLAPFIVHHV